MKLDLNTLFDDGEPLPWMTPVAEVANLPATAVTKLGCFLFAVGLGALSKGDSKSIANAFIKQTRDLQQFATLKKLGIPDTWLSSNPAITQGFADSLKKAIAKNIVNDTSVSAEEVKFIKFAVLFLQNPSKNDNYIDRARKFATTVSSAYLRNFDKVANRIIESGGTKSSSRNNIGDLYIALDTVMSDILGRKLKKGETSILNQTIKEIRFKSTKQADQVKEYKSLRRQLSQAYDVDLTSFMAASEDLIPVNEVYKHMKALGYRDHKVLMTEKAVPLKIGLVNGKIKYYTESGKPLNTNIPANAVDIKFAPRTYDESTGSGAYLSYTTPEALGVTRVYTEQHVTQATESKFNTATKVDSSIDKVLARWKKDLTATDPVTQMGATVSLLIYFTGMRVGSRQNTAASASGEKTFGAISLRPRHISITNTSIIIKYSGKKGVAQKHILKLTDTTNKRIAQNLKKYLEGKRGDDLVFSMKNKAGKDITLTYSAYTKYLGASGYPAGVHKMRHVRGTNLIIDMLNKEKWKPSTKAITNLTRRQKEAETFIIEKIIMPATELLGHKAATGKALWRTTIKSYINPNPLLKWFADHNLRKPSWLPTSASKSDE